ncbi:hypothetical protein [Catellatospora methionotrophica]|uniref:hypothetical protein n=1 Tax=Catellatospora methionotrophica TaxID=121620 RepID=UPI00140E1F80
MRVKIVEWHLQDFLWAVPSDRGELRSVDESRITLRPCQRSHFQTAVGLSPAFLQNLRRRHYEIAIDTPPARRVAAAFAELAKAI